MREISKPKSNKEFVNLKNYCEDAFSRAMKMHLKGFIRPKLIVSCKKTDINGQLDSLFLFCFNTHTIRINLYNILRNNSISYTMKCYYIYVTILHEITHIELHQRLRATEQIDYQTFFASWEQLSFPVFSGSISAIIDHNHSLDNPLKYGASFAESYCDYYAFKEAYETFDLVLSDEESSKIERIIDSISFCFDYQEITYNREGIAVNLFLRCTDQIRKTLKIKKNTFDIYIRLQQLFSRDGSFQFNPTYRESVVESSFYAHIVIELLLFFPHEIDTLINSRLLTYEEISQLANAYNNRCIYYLRNIERGRIYYPEKILEDNAAMLIKNLQSLYSYMKSANLSITGDMVIPLYSVER